VQEGDRAPAVPPDWKPNSVNSPALSRPLKDSMTNRTAPLAPVRTGLRELAAADGSVRATAQPLVPADPAVTRTVATNPPGHWFTETVAVQAPGAGGDEDDGLGDGDSRGSCSGSWE
jgi:hypothetical protein